MEWLNSIGQWFVEHYEGIMAFVSSSNVVAFGANIVLFVKTLAGLKDNASNTNALREALVVNEKLANDVAELRTAYDDIKAENKKLNEAMLSIKHDNDLLLNKVTSMLEVQSLVYATIKDEPTRVAVLGILANAKHDELRQRQMIKDELATLKEQLVEKTTEAVEQVSDAVEKATALVETVPQRG